MPPPTSRPRHPNRHHIHPTILLMANGGREPAQQPERHLLLGQRLAGLVAEQRKPILDILVSRRHDELKNRPAAFPVGH